TISYGPKRAPGVIRGILSTSGLRYEASTGIKRDSGTWRPPLHRSSETDLRRRSASPDPRTRRIILEEPGHRFLQVLVVLVRVLLVIQSLLRCAAPDEPALHGVVEVDRELSDIDG